MKFNINDRVKIVKISRDDPPYLLNQIGTIIKIREDKDYPYEIKFLSENMIFADEVLWQEHELDFDKPIINEFTKLSPESGDWEAWYLNGKLIAEGHSVRVEDILDALSDILLNTYKTIEISDEKAEEGFEVNLEDMCIT